MSDFLEGEFLDGVRLYIFHQEVADGGESADHAGELASFGDVATGHDRGNGMSARKHCQISE